MTGLKTPCPKLHYLLGEREKQHLQMQLSDSKTQQILLRFTAFFFFFFFSFFSFLQDSNINFHGQNVIVSFYVFGLVRNSNVLYPWLGEHFVHLNYYFNNAMPVHLKPTLYNQNIFLTKVFRYASRIKKI